MSHLLYASTAATVKRPLYDDTDGVTLETGLSPTFQIMKVGASDWSNAAGSVAEVGATGVYAVAFASGDTDTEGDLLVKLEAAGALTHIEAFQVGPIPADAVEISSDATAADNLETMLDGTGGKELSLGKLAITNVDDYAVEITASGAGADGVYIESANAYALNAFGILGEFKGDYEGNLATNQATIIAKTNQIGSVSVTYSSPVANDDSVTLYCGSDYSGNAQLSWTVSSWSGINVNGAAGKLRLQKKATWEYSSTATAEFEFAATVAQSGTTVTVTVDLTDTQTLTLSPSPPAETQLYHYDLVATTAGTLLVQELAAGWLTAKKMATAAA